jgi:hypothetical protein
VEFLHGRESRDRLLQDVNYEDEIDETLQRKKSQAIGVLFGVVTWPGINYLM